MPAASGGNTRCVVIRPVDSPIFSPSIDSSLPPSGGVNWTGGSRMEGAMVIRVRRGGKAAADRPGVPHVAAPKLLPLRLLAARGHQERRIPARRGFDRL